MADHELLGTNFRILQLFGIWTPKFDSVFLYGLYYLWRAVALLLILTRGFLPRIKGRNLPYSIWHPWSTEPIVSYALTLCYLTVSSLVSMPATISTDSLTYGCMILACSHIEILKLRLARLHALADLEICVEHHDIIFRNAKETTSRFAERIGDIFGNVIFVQFLLSMINLCSIMIVIVKSQSVIGAAMDNGDYVNLPIQIKKALLQIMVRSQNPAEIKAGRMLTLSLDTFMMILKASYSAFNLLQQVSTK